MKTRTGLPDGRQAEKTLAELQLDELVGWQRTHTEAVARLASQIVNDCVQSELIILGADGQATRNYNAAFGSIAVANFGGALTVASGGPNGAAPGRGVGVALVGPGMGRVFNMEGRSLTLYGTAGAQVHLEVFTKSQPPTFGPVL